MEETRSLSYSCPAEQAGFQLKIAYPSPRIAGCTALIGRSGSGKSTLVKALAGPWHQLSLTGAPPQTSGIGDLVRDAFGITGSVLAVPQDPLECLLPWLTIDGHKRLLVQTRGREVAESLVLHVERLDLPWTHIASKTPTQLSGGQQRRFALALTLAFAPSVLIIDEALGALDFETCKLVMDHLTQVTDSSSLRILLVSHDLYMICSYCRKALVVRSGGIGVLDRESRSEVQWLDSLRDALLCEAA